MRRAIVVLILLAVGVAPVVDAASANDPDRSQRVRVSADGGVAIPFYFPVPSWRIGPSAGLGLEFPRSDRSSIVVRAAYARANSRPTFPLAVTGTVDLVTVSLGSRFSLHPDRPLHAYAGGSVGGGFQRLTERRWAFPPPASTLETTSGGHALLAVDGGVELRAGTRLEVFLDASVVYVIGGGSSQYMPLRLGVATPL
jgi:hypothetical protein